MTGRSFASPVAIVVVLSAATLAGCFSTDSAEPVGPARVTSDPESGSSDGVPMATPSVRPSNARWHFHNLWGGSTTLTVLNATYDVAREFSLATAPAQGLTFTLPSGSLVPPEAGNMTIRASFVPTNVALSTGLEFEYRSANDSEFRSLGALDDSAQFEIEIEEAMTDVPHQGRSSWAFRVEPRMNAQGVAFANGTLSVHAFVTIGRPVLIDPPHPNPWRLGDTFLIAETERTLQVIGDVILENNTVTRSPVILDVRLANQRLIPEGASDVLITLAWDSVVPASAESFVVRYVEQNAGSNEVVAAEEVSEGVAKYRVPLTSAVIDSPYVKASGWHFEIALSDTTKTFDGTLRFNAWVTRIANSAIPPGAS